MSTSGQTGSLDKIKNIVIVLQENHTFDNYFGTYPGVEGINGKTICLPQSPNKTQNCIAPFHDSNLTPVDMNHNWKSAHSDYNNGKMDGFVYSEGNQETMGYYDRSNIPRYWAIADNYVLCDHYFTSVMSESAPNHLFLVAGSNGGIIDDNVPKPLNLPTVFEQLDQKRVSWKVYGFTKWYESFSYVQNNPTVRKNFSSSPNAFAQDLQNQNLAEVSWIVGAAGGSEHPPENIQTGQNSIADGIVNAIGSNASLWNSAAIFVTWDDYGGFYDHVSPPQIDQFGYGFRVPCLIISPFSRKGYIDKTTYDHASILKFIESRFLLSSMSTRDQSATAPIAAFDFSSAPRSFVSV
jgi:phospholipase C